MTRAEATVADLRRLRQEILALRRAVQYISALDGDLEDTKALVVKAGGVLPAGEDREALRAAVGDLAAAVLELEQAAGIASRRRFGWLRRRD